MTVGRCFIAGVWPSKGLILYSFPPLSGKFSFWDAPAPRYFGLGRFRSHFSVIGAWHWEFRFLCPCPLRYFVVYVAIHRTNWCLISVTFSKLPLNFKPQSIGVALFPRFRDFSPQCFDQRTLGVLGFPIEVFWCLLRNFTSTRCWWCFGCPDVAVIFHFHSTFGSFNGLTALFLPKEC